MFVCISSAAYALGKRLKLIRATISGLSELPNWQFDLLVRWNRNKVVLFCFL